MRDAVASYVEAIALPVLDERAIAARRRTLAITQTPGRSRYRALAVAAAAAVTVFLSFNVSAVVAGMERVFAAWTIVGGRTIPLTIREVDLAQARADVPFQIIVPPARAGTTMTLREALSSASPANDSVSFELNMGRSRPDVSIVETRSGAGPRTFMVALREPGPDAGKVAPLPDLSKLRGLSKRQLSVMAKLGNDAFVPLTWTTRGTRIVLVSPPGVLSAAQVHAIRSAMSD